MMAAISDGGGNTELQQNTGDSSKGKSESTGRRNQGKIDWNGGSKLKEAAALIKKRADDPGRIKDAKVSGKATTSGEREKGVTVYVPKDASVTAEDGSTPSEVSMAIAIDRRTSLPAGVHEQDKEGVHYPRKAMILYGLLKGLNGLWQESQLSEHLEVIIEKVSRRL
ncbi:hypothetical protein KRP22_000001 [Phytophthora ramorum]|nr:hypothetical protein KRP22_11948 [Phytophthora ramorum]